MTAVRNGCGCVALVDVPRAADTEPPTSTDTATAMHAPRKSARLTQPHGTAVGDSDSDGQKRQAFAWLARALIGDTPPREDKCGQPWAPKCSELVCRLFTLNGSSNSTLQYCVV